jgi:hypothetical protein
MKNYHLLLMILGYGLPVLFIFLSPSFGIDDKTAIFIFIIATLGAFELMPKWNENLILKLSVENLNEKINNRKMQ